MTARPDPEALAAALRAAHPDAEPFDAHPDDVARWIAAAGGDASDDRLTAAALVAWEAQLPY